MAIEVDRYRQQVFRYSLVDGTTELGLGLFLLLWAGLIAGPLTRGVDAAWFAVVFGAVALFALLTHYGTRLIRSRITYPRTGYVRPRVPKVMVIVPVILAFVIAIAMATLITRNPTDARLLDGMIGLVMGLAMFYKGWQMGVSRFLILGLMAMATGLVVPFFTLDLTHGQALLFVILGIAFLISGGLALWTYLRTAARQEDSVE